MKPSARAAGALLPVLTFFMLTSCTTMPKQLTVKNNGDTFPEGTIIAARTGQPITFEELLKDLEGARVVYVGETHTNSEHHLIQTRLIKALHRERPELSVGMEMFDHRYDPVLALWSAGALDREAFIEKSHWYARCAGWGFPFDLYAPIFEAIKAEGIRLVGLNVPFWIPSEIRVGGLASLLPDERRMIAAHIDTGNAEHRAYLESVFQEHVHSHIQSFEYFYEAQCAWEDTMAESIARKLGEGPMVVVIGNGHIQHKYGVPDRAYQRNPVPFRTIYLAAAGSEVDLGVADYIWVTP
jgi:uncharacterized iron-regulated protein